MANDAEERVRIAEDLPSAIPPDVERGWPGFKVQQRESRLRPRRRLPDNRLPGPSTAWRGRGLERPLQLEWGPDGALYVLDHGVITAAQTANGPALNASLGTGVIWRLAARAGKHIGRTPAVNDEAGTSTERQSRPG